MSVPSLEMIAEHRCREVLFGTTRPYERFSDHLEKLSLKYSRMFLEDLCRYRKNENGISCFSDIFTLEKINLLVEQTRICEILRKCNLTSLVIELLMPTFENNYEINENYTFFDFFRLAFNQWTRKYLKNLEIGEQYMIHENWMYAQNSLEMSPLKLILDMFPKLEHLAVRGFKVTQPFKPKSLVFNQHASIRILDIMASTLNSLDELENLVNLERLIMSKVKLANSKLCPLNKLTKLKYLDLSDSRLNWFEPNRYYEFDLSTLASPSLEILDISYTRKKLENFWQLEQSNPKLNSVFAFYSNVRCHSVSNVTLYTHKFLHTCIHVLSHYSEYGLTGHVAQALRILTASYKFTRERYEPFLDVFMKVNYECRMDNAVMIQMLNLLWTCDRSEMLSSQQRQALVEHTFDNLSTFRSDSHCTEKNRCALRMINNWFEQFPDELNQKIAKQMLKWANCSRFDWFVYGDTLCQFIRFLDPYDIKRLGDTNGLAMNLCENVSLRRTNIAFKELTKFSTKFCDELVKLKYSYLYRIERNSYIGYLLRVFDDSSSVYQFEIIRNILTKINIPDDLKMEKLDLVALNLKLLRQEDEEENAFNHRDDTINSFILYNKLYLCAGAICASICSSRPPVAAYTLVDICTIPINQISMDFVSFVGHEEFILGKALVSQRDEPVLYGLYTIRLLLRDSEFIHVFNKLKMGQIIEKLKNDGSRTQELGGRIRELAATILETVAFKNRNRS